MSKTGDVGTLRLTKQRDGPRDLQLGFKLPTITVGVDPVTDKEITAAVAVPFGVPGRSGAVGYAPARRPKRLTVWQGHVMSAWAAAKGFEDAPPTRSAVFAAAEVHLREVNRGELPPRWRFLFNRALGELVESGRLAEMDDRLGPGVG